MASPAVLDIDSLIAPIPGSDPAGDTVPYDIRAKLEEARKEDDPANYADDDPMRPENPKKADWANVTRLTQETLTRTSKDLLVAARLMEALVKQHGFAGLRDGLQLFRRLVEECWDRVHPVIEGGDIEVRAGPFHWLDDPDKGARFPNTIRRVPIVQNGEAAYGWWDWRHSQDGKGTVTREDFEKAIVNTPVEQCRLLAEDLGQCHDELNKLVAALTTKMGDASPGLTAVKPAVEACVSLVQQILQRKDPGAAAGAGGTDGQPQSAGVAGAPARPAGSRDEAYRQLAQAAAVLQQLEPHSPIPYLVQRAVRLGSMPFPELIKELVREANTLSELKRELGIKEETTE